MSYNDLISKSRFFKQQEISPKIETSKEIRLNIGCGPNLFPSGWINYDREDFNAYLNQMKTADLKNFHSCIEKTGYYLQNNIPIDFRIHDLRKGFQQHTDNSIDGIYSGQVIEHLNPLFEIPQFLKECYRMLKPGTIIRMATPDLDIMIDAYKNGQMDKFACEQPGFYRNYDPSAQLSLLMFGAAGEKSTWSYYEGHMFLFTRKSMTTELQKAGFKDIVFYYEDGKSLDPAMVRDTISVGMTHSFIVEAVK